MGAVMAHKSNNRIDYHEIGQNIRIQRIRLGLNQAELAEMVDVTWQHISHVECATSYPSLALLIAVANALQTDMNTLLGRNLQEGAYKKLLAEQIGELLDKVPPDLVLHLRGILLLEINFYNRTHGLPEV